MQILDMKPFSIQYLKKVGEEHRKTYAQFFTHPLAAKFMVNWVLQSEERVLYDPAFGLGAFFEPVSSDLCIKFTGSEIDSEILAFWMEVADGEGAKIISEDYLLSWGKTHTNIVCNPPYMRFQKFSNRDKVFRAFADNLNLRLSGYTNTASAFLLKSLSELSGSGRLAYIMPLEFLNTGYGTIVKSRLIENRHLASIISLDCERDVFPDATTSVGIILYDSIRNYPYVDFHTISSVHSLENVLSRDPINRIAVSHLDPNKKWLPYFQAKVFSIDEQMTVTLSRYGNFSRGIATGANKFFVMKPSRAQELGLSPLELLPCITRSSQMQKLVFNREDYNDLVKTDAPILLFNAGTDHSKYADSYIQEGERQGYHARYLTRNRRPWYKVEHRFPAPLLLGVFSRGGYKVIRNRSNALNLTCFHGFQPNELGERYIDQLFLYLMSAPGRDIVSLSGRRYGDALDKFEPNDLNSAIVPHPRMFDELSDKDIASAISETEKKHKVPRWVDEFFKKLKTRKETVLERRYEGMQYNIYQ